MKVEQRKRIFATTVAMLPPSVRSELVSLSGSRRDFYESLREVRLRGEGICSVVLGSIELPLMSKCTSASIEATLGRITEESLYAYKDSIARGFVALEDGVRVGISGRAGYEDGRLVGISEVSSLAFRFPFAECGFAEELYRDYRAMGRGNLLIISPPSGGKTTALRAIAGLIASGEGARRVAVIDDREEFVRSDYSGCLVDLIRGYQRRHGVQIALRTLSAHTAVMDEIATEEDCRAVMDCYGAGVEIIATAHGDGGEALWQRPALRELAEGGVFSAVATLYRAGDSFEYSLRLVKSCSLQEIPVECIG